MAKTVMPELGGRRGGSNECRWCSQWVEGIEVTYTIAPDDHVPSLKVLHRETKGIKLNRNLIIDSKLPHRNKVLDDVRCKKNVIEGERM